MAEEQQGQEKTEEATPRKLEKAKQDGQLARSRELNSVAIVTFGAVAAIATLPGVAVGLANQTVSLFQRAGDPHLSLPLEMGRALTDSFLDLTPLLAILFIAGVISSIALGGVVLAPKAIQPKLERLSFIKGIKRIFSMRALVELGKSIAKFVLIAGIAIAVLNVLLPDLLAMNALPIASAAYKGAAYVGVALLLVGAGLIVVAAIDIPFQIAQHKKQLRMTKQEVKDELKDSEGKPEVKAKIRALQQQVANRQMLEAVPDADVVITNPEHFAVAVRYDAQTMAAPQLVAKGMDYMAFRIREIAQREGVPIVELPPLARAIYHITPLDGEVPAELYVAVAQVLAYVYQMDEYRRGLREEVPNLGPVEVPRDLYEDPDRKSDRSGEGDLQGDDR